MCLKSRDRQDHITPEPCSGECRGRSEQVPDWIGQSGQRAMSAPTNKEHVVKNPERISGLRKTELANQDIAAVVADGVINA